MSKMFKAPKFPVAAAPPPIPKPTPMPDAEDPAKKVAAQKAVARRIAKAGSRESTFITQNQKDKLGG